MKQISHKQRVKSLWNRLAAGLLGTITGVATEQSAVALTFDDGPNPRFTLKLARVLEKHGARGTFFVVGQSASRYPELIARLVRGGHAVGNHSWDHKSFLMINSRQRRKQVRLCEEALQPYGSKIFRPPFGHQDLKSRFDLFLSGYRVVTWSVLAEDWLDMGAEDIFRKLESGMAPGSIILLHDSLFACLEPKYADRSATIEAVEMLLQKLGNDYSFVTVPQLLRMGRPRKVLWRRRPDISWMKRLKIADSAFLF